MNLGAMIVACVGVLLAAYCLLPNWRFPMGIDVRLPIGAMFSFVGLLLTVYGAARPLASQSVGVNINLTWGVVLLVFGILMILLGRRRSQGRSV